MASNNPSKDKCMALPKAMLCILGEQNANAAPAEEALLRASGFATASIHWSEVASQQRGWTQLLPILDDPALQAWVFAGHPADFTDEILSQTSMLTLAMTRTAPPMTAFVLLGSGEEPALPELLGHIKIFYGNTSFAPKLAALRQKPRPALPRPFHVQAHVDPLIGQWLELGPAEGKSWPGFTVGVVGAEIMAFGVGPRGAIPQKSTLIHPQTGIKGEWADKAFSACAAQNELDRNTACYIKVEGCPSLLFVTAYAEEQKNFAEQDFELLDLF